MDARVETATEFELKAETLAGDIRDIMLGQIRGMETPWSKLSERDQQWRIDLVRRAANELVRQAIFIVAGKGFPCLPVTIGKLSVDKGVKLEVGTTREYGAALFEHESDSGILVLASAAGFYGARAEVKADPDEPEIPLGDEGHDPATGEVHDEPAKGRSADIPKAARTRSRQPEPA